MTQANTPSADAVLQATATIVSAYVQTHNTPPQELGALLQSIYTQVTSLAPQPQATISVMQPDGQQLSLSIEETVQPDYIICLEDGKKLKMLKRYLKTNYNLTPEEYRARWSLPASYPMVAPEYAKRRSALAKDIGLGKAPARVQRMNAAASQRRSAAQ